MDERITPLGAGKVGIPSLREALANRVQETIQELLKLELDEALGALRHERTGGRQGYRNGSYERTIVTEAGAATLRIPRGRVQADDGKTVEHKSKILPAYQRRTQQVDKAIVACYLAGANTRKISKALAPLFGESQLSKSSVSRIVVKLRDHFDEWMRRDLSEEKPVVVYLDGMLLPVRMARRVTKAPVLVVIGVREGGEKVLLSLQIAPTESGASWSGIVRDLADRGMAAPKLVIADGAKGLKSAVEDVWPTADFQRCTKHKLANLLDAAPKYCHAEVKREYDEIVYAKDLKAAQKAYDAFVSKWSKHCPAVAKSLQEAGHHLLTFYQYPKPQWKSLRTTNHIERLNGEFRRRTKTQASFGTELSALVLLWALVAFGQIRLRRISGWKEMPAVLKMLNEAA